MKLNLLALLTASSTLAQVDYTDHGVYRFNVETESELNTMKEFVTNNQLDTWTKLKLGQVDIRLSPEQQSLIPTGIYYQKTIKDLQSLINGEKIIDAQSDNLAHSNFPDQYHSLDEIYNWMKSISSGTIFKAGDTYENRSILGIKFTNPDKQDKDNNNNNKKKVILVHGGIHAREWIATATVVYIINAFSKGTDSTINEMLKTYDFHFIPVVNGDGYEFTRSKDRMWRKNRQPNSNSNCVGTDLNRNWGFEWRPNQSQCSEAYPGPTPFSSPETTAIAHYIHENDVISYLDLHAYGQMFMGPYGYTCSELSPDAKLQNFAAQAATSAIAAASKRRYKQGSICNVIYQAYGSSVDWAYRAGNVTYPYGVELPDTGRYGFILPPSMIPSVGSEILAGLKALVNAIKSSQ